MKKYNTPMFTRVELRIEESLANLTCAAGSCDFNNNGKIDYNEYDLSKLTAS